MEHRSRPGRWSPTSATWDDALDINVYGEVVHHLNDLGAVITQAGHGTSQQGFQAEWREIGLFIFDGDLLSHYELFDEADLDGAIQKFEQLSTPAPTAENSASKVAERFMSHYAKGDWGAIAEILASNFASDDRRRVVGAGIRQGPDAQIEDMRAMTDLAITKITATAVAVRGERLCSFEPPTDPDQGPGVILTEVLAIVEIDTEERVFALISFDHDDIDAAFEELDTRYGAGEAATHAHTWSMITQTQAAYNQREIPDDYR